MINYVSSFGGRKFVTIEDVAAYINSLQPDDLVDIMEDTITEDLRDAKKKPKRTLKAVVIARHGHVTETSRGTFRNIDLYFWNNGGYR